MNFASSPHILSIRLRRRVPREEVSKSNEDAVSINRPLAMDRLDALCPDLAYSLTHFSIRLLAFSRFEVALKVIEEALGIPCPLAAERRSTEHNLNSGLLTLTLCLGPLQMITAVLSPILYYSSLLFHFFLAP